MFSRFLKPKWLHKNPKVRIVGIDALNDAETLVNIASEDQEPSVQAAAIKKINRIEDLLRIKANDVLQLQIDLRLSAILLDNPLTQFTPEIGQQLRRIANSELNQKIAIAAFDADMRAAAVALISDQNLLAELATQDSAHTVRNNAAIRLNDEAIIHQTIRQLGKKDKRVAKTLRAKLEQLTADKALVDELAKAQRTVNNLGQQAHWQRDQTRLQSIINQTSGLLEKASQSEQSQLKLAIDNAQQRIAEQAEYTKALQPVIEAKESQCQLIEDFHTNLKKRRRVSTNEAEDFSLTLDTLLDDWDDIPLLDEKQEAIFSNRFHQGLTHARHQLKTLHANARQSSKLENCIHKAEELKKRKTLNRPQVNSLMQDWEQQAKPQDEQLAAEYQQQFSRLAEALEQKLEKHEHTTKIHLAEMTNWLDQIEDTLAIDKLGNAETLTHKVQSALRQHRDLPQTERQKIQQRLQDIHPKIRELSGWRHWGTDRAREELIEEATRLKETQQTIETRAGVVKSLRKRWKELGKIDPVSGQRLWKKFDAACSDAYAPCKAHFAEQAQQRQQYLKQRKQICSELENLANNTNWSSPDWRHVDKQFHQLLNQWRNTGSISKKDWQSIFKRFNAAVDRVDQHLQDERRINQNQRLALIEKLQAQAENEDLNDAIRQARELQKQWQPTVTCKRGDEQKMWLQYRAASDAIFDRKKEKQKAENKETQKLIEAKEDLCAEFEDLILDKKLSAGDITKYEARWTEIGYLHDKEGSMLNHRFSKAKNSAEQFLQAAKAVEKQQLLDQMYQRKCLLDQYQQHKNRSQLEHDWTELENMSDRSLLRKFDDLYQSTLNGDIKFPVVAQTEKLLLDLEIALELESPAKFKEQRMSQQVKRLSQKLSKGNSDANHHLAAEKFEQYCLTHASPEQTGSGSLERLGKIKTALDKQAGQ